MAKFYAYTLLNLIASAGLSMAKASINRKGITFINRMSILNTFLMLIFSFVLPLLNLTQVLYFTIPFTFLFALPPWLNYKGYFSFCRYYFSILPLVFLIGVCIHNGAALGDKYLILTTATIPLLLFRDKKKIYLLFALNVLVFVLISWYQLTFEPLITLTPNIAKVYFSLSLLTVFLLLFYVILYFRSYTDTYEAELEEKNRIISLKNHEIIDSIVYAKRLQEAIMPPVKEI